MGVVVKLRDRTQAAIDWKAVVDRERRAFNELGVSTRESMARSQSFPQNDEVTMNVAAL